jgi:hypothetical protein
LIFLILAVVGEFFGKPLVLITESTVTNKFNIQQESGVRSQESGVKLA